jgi:tRNA pseudouridine55 synthase
MLVVDKPPGITSFDVIRRLKSFFHPNRIGHTGTLDPLASGVLCVCVGWGLKLLQYLEDDYKVYTATMRLGVATDTDDAEGEVLSEAPVCLTEKEVSEALILLKSITQQVPPKYSALKVQGKRSYARMRAGEEVKLKARQVRVDEMQLEACCLPLITVRVVCGKGTYIRSLCRDLGERLGCGAHLAGLRREASGISNVSEAVSLDAFMALSDEEKALRVIPPRDMLRHLPELEVDEPSVQALRYGQKISSLLTPGEKNQEVPGGGLVKIISSQNQSMVALGRCLVETGKPTLIEPVRVRSV